METNRSMLLAVSALAASMWLAGCERQDDTGQGDAAQQESQGQSQQQAQDQRQTRSADDTGRQRAGGPLPAPENVDAPPADATVTESGLAYVILQDSGSGTSPQVEDTVTVHYSGWTTDGEMFDSSVTRGEPATFPLNRLIPGWQEAIPLMNVGDKYRFWIPGELAYDNSPRPDAPRGTLVFDIELLAVHQSETADNDEVSSEQM